MALLVLSAGESVKAAPVHGAITFADGAVRELPEDEPRGFWRLDLGVTPLARTPPFRESLVVLEPLVSSNKSAPGVATVELRGLHLEPRVVALGVGGTVTFKNGDRLPHTLRIEGATAAPTVLPAGQTYVQKFGALGEFEVKADEEPYVHGWVVSVATPYVAVPDERGQWKLDLPEGHYRLRVFLRGAWLGERTIEVGKAPLDLPLRLDEAAAEPGTTAVDSKSSETKKEAKKQ